MTSSYVEILRSHAHMLSPQPTGVDANLRRLDDVRAVTFDVYGTMFVSSSGEVGTVSVADRAEAWFAAMKAVRISCTLSAREGVELLHETITSHQRQLTGKGVDYPEVSIVDVWRDVVDQLKRRTSVDEAGDQQQQVDFCRLAVEYESHANPVWPMPGLISCLKHLSRVGLLLGIISNAQFFTLDLFPALLRCTAEEIGFERQLQYYSYRYHRAKPGEFLFQRAKQDLSSRGIDADQILYVGNDMLNDVMPAQRLGFRTALFAGDARSLRLRENDPRVRNVSPDVVLTDLGQLKECVPASLS